MESDHLLKLYVGSYATAAEAGIKCYQFDQQTAQFQLLTETYGICNPSFLAFSNQTNQLYAVSEADDLSARICQYSYSTENGKLKLKGERLTYGESPCHVWVDPDDQVAVTANYTGGSISLFSINNSGHLMPAVVSHFEGGQVGSERQSKSFLHCIYPSPDGRYVFANDLGADKIYAFRLIDKQADSLATFVAIPALEQTLPAGTGPRHALFHPNARWLYVLGELSGMISVFSYTGEALIPIQTIEADSVHAGGSADIQITSDGRFLYASNRLANDGIAIFSVHRQSGELTKIGYQSTGDHPRNMIITPNNRYLLCACRFDNTIQAFEIDPETGLLTQTPDSIETKEPVCLKFMPQIDIN